MVFAYSPHRDSGGTLHVPSPTDSPRTSSNSALAQLRRSLSRSPSKGPAFRLVTSRSNSSSPNSPLTPSPLSPSRRGGMIITDPAINLNEPAPLNSPFHPSLSRKRPTVRHLSPMRPSTRSLSAQRSPAKRALADSSDNGNATLSPFVSSGNGLENKSRELEASSDKQDIQMLDDTSVSQESSNHLAPHHALGRREKPNGYFDIAKSSPLKRSEGSTNLELAFMGTPAKRRSLHGASFGPDFNIFDQAARAEEDDSCTQVAETGSEMQNGHDSPGAFTPLPHRSSSLRKTTLQHRFEKPTPGRTRGGPDSLFENRTPATPEVKARNRLSLEFPVPQLSRDSPFTSANLPSASIHPAPLMRREASGQSSLPMASRHPLARTISQSSSNSSVAQDSPTHIPPRHPEVRRPRGDLSKSLPLGSLRPALRDVPTAGPSSEQSSFATPDNYKLAKPLPAAFMSTGLISKRNKNIDHEDLEMGENTGNMPDTPCKRPTSMTSLPPEPTPDINFNKARQTRHTMHCFGSPSAPFSPHSRPPITDAKGLSIFGSSFNNGDVSRRGSFTAPDIEDGLMSPLAAFQGKHNKSLAASPTPRKQGFEYAEFTPAAGLPSPDPSYGVQPDTHENSVTQPPKATSNCKSNLISAPVPVKEGDNEGESELSPSNVLRFRSLNSISSFSKRPQAAGRAHCPTPLSKTSLSLSIISKKSDNAKQSPLPTASPIFERHGGNSPHTPLDAMVPPDPSGLSISVQAEKTNMARPESISFNSSFGVPATPTAVRDSFGRSSKFTSSLTPVHHALPAEVDESITSRFDKVEPLSSGEFSQVFRVCQRSKAAAQQGYFPASQARHSPKAPLSEQVWAVKKSNKAYIGPRDRLRKLQEVQVLKALGHADHTVNYVDSWECNNHLFIQTEFCEEGPLDSFLERAGQKGRLDDFRIWKIMLELSLGLKHIHDSGFIHLDLKPANILVTFEGVLKIADFGMAALWPASAGIEGEGDRGYIGPEILRGQFDKPADVFAFGLIMLEIAGNVRLPDNGASWQRLRSGDMSDVPSLTSSSETSNISRDAFGNPDGAIGGFDELPASHRDSGYSAFDFGFDQKSQASPNGLQKQTQRAGELHTPPNFMVDPDHGSALDKVVRWMISPEASDRPTADGILATEGVRWVEARRRSGATIFEGNYGPADEILQHDAEMIDV